MLWFLCLKFFLFLTQQVSYKYLIIALGISLHYEKVFVLQNHIFTNFNSITYIHKSKWLFGTVYTARY